MLPNSRYLGNSRKCIYIYLRRVPFDETPHMCLNLATALNTCIHMHVYMPASVGHES